MILPRTADYLSLQRIALTPGFAFVLTCAFTLLYVPTVFSTPVFVRSDAGVFLSFFHQVSLGRLLYVEVFDHKDPLFHYAYSLAYRLFGIIGPMLWETVITVGILATMTSILSKFGLRFFEVLLVLVLFVSLYFSPAIYLPVHTYHQTTLLWLMSIRLAQDERPYLAGVVYAASIFSKMPMLALFPTVGLIVVSRYALTQTWDACFKNGVRLLLGGLSGLAIVVGLLAARGELKAYVSVVEFNFTYSQVLSSFYEARPLWTRFGEAFNRLIRNEWAGVVLADCVLCFTLIVPSFLLRGREMLGPLKTGSLLFDATLVAVTSSVGVIAILSVGAFFNHYFQLIGAVFALDVIPLVILARRLTSGFLQGGVGSLFAAVVVAIQVASGFDGHFQQQVLSWPPSKQAISLLDDSELACLFPPVYTTDRARFVIME